MKESKLNRRQFLVAAGTGSAAAVTTATVLIGSKQAAPAAEVVAAPAAKVKGYHVSEHIEKYYKTTEI